MGGLFRSCCCSVLLVAARCSSVRPSAVALQLRLLAWVDVHRSCTCHRRRHPSLSLTAAPRSTHYISQSGTTATSGSTGLCSLQGPSTQSTTATSHRTTLLTGHGFRSSLCGS